MEQKLWVVMFSTQIADEIRKLLESGKFTQATTTNDLLKAFQDKIQSEVQQSGGHLHVFLPEWMVIEITPSLAEQIPQMVSSFNEQVGYSLATGIGLNFGEAVKAAKISEETGEIQLFEESMNKSLELPPNLFDYDDQSIANNDNTDAQEQTYTPGPDYKQSLQLAAEQLQAIIQQLGGQAQEEAAQQVQQIQQQQQAQMQQQAQAQPRDLVEGLNGGQVEGRNPYRGDSSEDSDKDSDESDDSDETEKDEEPTDDGEEDEVQQKLGGALLHIKEQIPQLMDLAEKNPDAFKQSMTLIQKLLSLTKQTKSGVEKSESEALTEQLNKRIVFPVGTTKNRKKKVLVNGKQVWRSMISGSVQDLTGQPISGKSSNVASEKGTQPKEE